MQSILNLWFIDWWTLPVLNLSSQKTWYYESSFFQLCIDQLNGEKMLRKLKLVNVFPSIKINSIIAMVTVALFKLLLIKVWRWIELKNLSLGDDFELLFLLAFIKVVLK